jgi:lipid-binding SYLF domain-containing protein
MIGGTIGSAAGRNAALPNEKGGLKMSGKSALKIVAMVLAMLMLSASIACAATKEEKRQHIRDISQKTLDKLYELQPSARHYVEKAAGYAVFGNWGVKLLFIGGGTGKGMAVNNETDEETFMDMVTGSVGLGLGAKTYNVVFVFEKEYALKTFTTEGWQFGGQATAAATDSVSGGAYQGAFSVSPDVWMYVITDKGLALEVTLKGTKYSRNDLN